MSTFRRYGGLNYSANNNIVRSYISNSEQTNINNYSGLPNSKEIFKSHIDLDGNSLLHTGTIYFQDGTSLSTGISTGPQGTTGIQGPQGFQGNQGMAGGGPQGYQGFQGDQGYQGFQGNQGITGGGPQGFQGDQGFQGNQGFQGFQGLQGFQGPQGFQGDQGFQGFQGYQGPQGFQGEQGFQGPQGFQGFQGPQGFQGFQGFQGYGATASYWQGITGGSIQNTNTGGSVNVGQIGTGVTGGSNLAVYGNGSPDPFQVWPQGLSSGSTGPQPYFVVTNNGVVALNTFTAPSTTSSVWSIDNSGIITTTGAIQISPSIGIIPVCVAKATCVFTGVGTTYTWYNSFNVSSVVAIGSTSASGIAINFSNDVSNNTYQVSATVNQGTTPLVFSYVPQVFNKQTTSFSVIITLISVTAGIASYATSFQSFDVVAWL